MVVLRTQPKHEVFSLVEDLMASGNALQLCMLSSRDAQVLQTGQAFALSLCRERMPDAVKPLLTASESRPIVSIQTPNLIPPLVL